MDRAKGKLWGWSLRGDAKRSGTGSSGAWEAWLLVKHLWFTVLLSSAYPTVRTLQTETRRAPCGRQATVDAGIQILVEDQGGVCGEIGQSVKEAECFWKALSLLLLSFPLPRVFCLAYSQPP